MTGRSGEIGIFTPEQARLLWSDYQERKQLHPSLQKNYPLRRAIDEPSPHRVFVKNTEEEEMPAYACVEILGTDIVGDRTVVEVCKPTKIGAKYLFIGDFAIPAEDEEEELYGLGWAFRFGVVRMLGAPPATPRQYRPIVGSYEIEEGAGPFTVYGDDDIGEDVLIGRFDANFAMLGRAGVGGISTSSASTVTLYDESGGGYTLGSRTVSCWAFPTAVAPNADVLIFEIGSRLVAFEVC